VNKLISPKIISLSFAVLVILFLVIFYAVAWQEPTQAPPQGNIATPLNTGPENQTKEGGLTLNTGGSENALVIDQGKICFGSDCRSSWPRAGVILTYQMSVSAYVQGNTYYSKGISYNCPEGSNAIQIYCSTIMMDARYGQDFNACVCSTGGRTASLTQQVSKCDSYMGYPDCSPASSCTPYTWYDSGGLEYMSIFCELPPTACVMEFQCGVKQAVGE
jgi:hypothetical protein